MNNNESNFNKNVIDNDDEINTIYLNRVVKPTYISENDVNKNVYKEVVLEPKNNSNFIFVILLLILFAIICIIFALFIIPNINNDDKNYESITTTSSSTYSFKKVVINDNFISSDGLFNVSSDFKIETNTSQNQISISVNDKYISTNTRLYNVIGLVDDLLIFAVDNNVDRTGDIFVVDINGTVIKEYNEIGNTSMKLIIGSSMLNINENSFSFSASKVVDRKLYLDDSVIDVCEENSNIDGTYNVINTYIIQYLGNHTFSDPTITNNTTLDQYNNVNNYCK